MYIYVCVCVCVCVCLRYTTRNIPRFKVFIAAWQVVKERLLLHFLTPDTKALRNFENSCLNIPIKAHSRL